MQVRAPIIRPEGCELHALLQLRAPGIARGGTSETEVCTTAGIAVGERATLARLLIEVLSRVADVRQVRILSECYVLT